MSYIKFHNEKIDEKIAKQFIEMCPFNAIEADKDNNLSSNSACKLCKICIKRGPVGCVELIEDSNAAKIDKSQWKGIVVFAEHSGKDIASVVFELLNKARELASKINHSVYALWIGADSDGAEELLHFGADSVYCYCHKDLRDFKILPYTDVFEDFINKIKPCACLVGATNLGRSLGPRIAARLKTGMTADCTRLEMRENTDLVQIRPAFGGNIMAKILCTNTRPQFCTVREKVFDSCERLFENQDNIVNMQVPTLTIKNKVMSNNPKQLGDSIADSDVLVAIGRGLQKPDDVAIFEELAGLLNAKLASSRALTEIGWMPTDRQIGLSGKTVKPKLLITFGISGAVQFAAGISGCEHVIAVNNNPDAPIFDVADVKVVDDMYEIANNMIEQLKQVRG